MPNQTIPQKIKQAYQHVAFYFTRLPIITRYLVLTLMVMFILGQFVNLSFLVLKNFAYGFNPLQLISYALVEFDFVNLLFSVLAIWLFGYQIEEYWGYKRYAIFVTTCVLGTAIFHLILGTTYAYGSTGLLFGLLLAYAMMWPDREVYLLLPPIPVKAKYLLMIYAAIVFLSMLGGQGTFLSKLAYLGGPVCGYLLIQYWCQKPPFNKSKRSTPKKNHLSRLK